MGPVRGRIRNECSVRHSSAVLNGKRPHTFTPSKKHTGSMSTVLRGRHGEPSFDRIAAKWQRLFCSLVKIGPQQHLWPRAQGPKPLQPSDLGHFGCVLGVQETSQRHPRAHGMDSAQVSAQTEPYGPSSKIRGTHEILAPQGSPDTAEYAKTRGFSSPR